MHGNFWWSLAFFHGHVPALSWWCIIWLAVLAARTGRTALLWAFLALDSLLVGYLGLVLATTQVLIARRATERSQFRAPRGVTNMPGNAPPSMRRL